MKIMHKMRWRNYSQTLSKLSNLNASLDHYLAFYTVCFYCMLIEDYRNKLKLNCRPLAFTHETLFNKDIKRSRASLPASFLPDFWKKIFFLFGKISLSRWLYLVRYWAIFVLLIRLWRRSQILIFTLSL